VAKAALSVDRRTGGTGWTNQGEGVNSSGLAGWTSQQDRIEAQRLPSDPRVHPVLCAKAVVSGPEGRNSHSRVP